MLHSGRVHERFARWSLIAQPREWIVGDGLALLNSLNGLRRKEASANSAFPPGWIAALSYDLGRACEPAAQARAGARDDRGWPDIHLARVDHALLFDHSGRKWFAIGDVGDLIESFDGYGASTDASFRTGALRSSLCRERHATAVERVLEYIRAGDVYQVNLSRRLSASFAGSSRALACSALGSSAPWYGAYLELPSERTLISLSPELFLQTDGATGRITTRPIKGTLPAARPAADLLHSEKDAAELHMIVDLMRNDIGRVCQVGSVRVHTPRMIESHPTVHHGVAEIEGILRGDATIEAILRATFPAGSVTGVPKIRAMQIIDELEPVRRGPYCGAIGFVSDSGDLTLNVAIRTIAITGTREAGRFERFKEATLDYGTGGGIVADSTPRREWEETEQKAAVLRQAIAQAPVSRSRPRANPV